MLVSVNDLEHHFAFFRRHFLCISRIGHRFILVVFQPNMPQLAIGHVFHVNPLNLELAFKLVLHPNATSGIGIVQGAQHFRHSTKVSRSVDREKEENGACASLGLEGRVQPLVAVLRGTPDFVLDAAVNVVFTEAFNDKVSSVLRTHIKALGVVFVDTAKVFQDGVGHGLHTSGASTRLIRAHRMAAAATHG